MHAVGKGACVLSSNGLSSEVLEELYRECDGLQRFFDGYESGGTDCPPVFKGVREYTVERLSASLGQRRVDAKKVLIVKPTSIGDLVQMSACVTMLKDQRPAIELSLLTERDGYDLFSEDPRFRKLWLFDRTSWLREGRAYFETMAKNLMGEIRSKGYDLVINLHHSPRAVLLTQLAGGSATIGLCSADPGCCKPITVEEQEFVDSFSTFNTPGTTVRSMQEIWRQGRTRIELHKRLFLPLGVDVSRDYRPTLIINNRPHLLQKFSVKEPYILAATGNSWKSGRWPVSHWVELLGRLADTNVVLVGRETDIARNREISREMGSSNILDITGQTSVLEYAALVRSASKVICNDSSAAHLGGAFNKEVHVMFGPTPSELCRPPGDGVFVYYASDSCRIGPCCEMICKLGGNGCMRAILPVELIGRLAPLPNTGDTAAELSHQLVRSIKNFTTF